MGRSITSVVVSAMAVSAFAFAGAPAASAAPTDIPLEDSTAILETVVPAVAAPSANPLDAQPEAIIGDAGSDTVITPTAPEEAVDSVAITAQGISGNTSAENGVASVVADDDKEALYVQPTDDGVRLMSVIADANSETSWDYSFASTSGETLTPEITPEGAAVFRNADGEMVGSLSVPWAYDARKVPVPTAFEIRDGVVTQTVDVTDTGIQFPVVADPNWT